MFHFAQLVLYAILLALYHTATAQTNNGAKSALKSIDETCNELHTLLTYQRRVVGIKVTKQAPLRIKVDMELTTPSAPSVIKRFSVEGMVCQNGFDYQAAVAACRSLNKNMQMFTQNFNWKPSPTDLFDKCYFEYNEDPFVAPCDFVLDNFNCSSAATSLKDCSYTPLFQHTCTNSMHVGVICSGIYEPPTTTTTTTQRASTGTTTTTDEQTVTNVLNRHNWTDIGAVIDVTGSMSGCYSQIDQWVAMGHTNRLVRYFVFFNDGDDAPDDNKVIGSTGGIYSVFTSEGIEKILATLKTAKSMGSGGDAPENDIEAIIHTIRTCPTCENIIHIADNAATPRDLILLNQVTKPVKVIICRLASGTVNPKLLDIAHKTGGSLHTLTSDIETLSSLKIGDTIRVGSGLYRLDATGFVRIA